MEKFRLDSFLLVVPLLDSRRRAAHSAERSDCEEMASSNIQLLYARHPRPALNWFLSEPEVSLSTDRQPCFPPSTTSHANYSPICSPSRSRTFSPSLPFFPPLLWLCLIIWSFPPVSVRLTESILVQGLGAQTIPLICLHCKAKRFCVLLFD